MLHHIRKAQMLPHDIDEWVRGRSSDLMDEPYHSGATVTDLNGFPYSLIS